MTHPELIRKWFNEQAQPDVPPPFDLETPPVPQPPVLAPRDAEKVIKIIERAASTLVKTLVKYLGEIAPESTNPLSAKSLI